MDVDYYNTARGIYSPLVLHGDKVAGFWLVGNNYQNKTELFGSYPPSYLQRMRWLFPDEFGGLVLHLFSGTVPSTEHEHTLDLRPETHPTYLMDAEAITSDILPKFDLILADPPYDDNHVKYGTPKMNKTKVVHNCTYILKPGGYLAWLDTIMPMFSKKDGWAYKGSIGLCQSTNHKVRVITLLQFNPTKPKKMLADWGTL